MVFDCSDRGPGHSLPYLIALSSTPVNEPSIFAELVAWLPASEGTDGFDEVAAGTNHDAAHAAAERWLVDHGVPLYANPAGSDRIWVRPVGDTSKSPAGIANDLGQLAWRVQHARHQPPPVQEIVEHLSLQGWARLLRAQGATEQQVEHALAGESSIDGDAPGEENVLGIAGTALSDLRTVRSVRRVAQARHLPFNVTLFYKGCLFAVMLCLRPAAAREDARIAALDLLAEYGLSRIGFTDLDNQIYVNPASQAFSGSTPPLERVLRWTAHSRIARLPNNGSSRFRVFTVGERAGLRGLDAQGYALLAHTLGASWQQIDEALVAARGRADSRVHIAAPASQETDDLI